MGYESEKIPDRRKKNLENNDDFRAILSACGVIVTRN
jgi:hypothetical protein